MAAIGAHSVSHPALSTLPPEERHQEIVESRDVCEALVGQRITGFAYPYGDMSPAVRDEVARSGFDWACSTESGPVAGDKINRFALPRVAVSDWDRDAFARALRLQ